MKRGTIAMLAFLFAIVSCQKEDIINQDTDAAEDVSTFLKMATSASTTSTCNHADSVSDPLHRERHHHINITEIDITTLSSAITSYITTNYAGSIIDKAGTDSLGNFYIKIMKADSSYIGLLFDANGNFIKELIRGHRGHRGIEISSSALPASALSYITANYPTSSIHKAILENDSTYKVILNLADGTYLGLAFDASGNFISTITVKDKHGRKKRRK